VPPAVVERLRALDEETRAPYRDLPYASLAVLDVDLEGGWMVAGGGFEVGVRRGASALLPEGYVGVVDRVLPHLARVELLSARGTRLPVRALRADGEDPLPGSLAQLFGVVEGRGEDAVLTTSQLPGAFRVGDRLSTLDATGAGSWPVGQVVSEGPLPTVSLDATPVGVPLVAIAGPEREVPRSDLFETVRFDVVLRAPPPHAMVVIAGRGVSAVLPGSAVRAGMRFLGRVISAGSGLAQVAPLRDARRRLGVVLVPEDGAPRRAEILWVGGRLWRVIRRAPGARATGPVLVVTGGGDQLITPGLLVAAGTLEGDRLELDELPPWPSRVEVDRFRYGEERGDLLRGRRR
jgi:hypothetical protein